MDGKTPPLTYFMEHSSELERVTWVSGFALQTEQYVRNLSLVLGGLFLKQNDEEASRDIRAAIQAADEMVGWISRHRISLETRARDIRASQKAEVPAATVVMH
jgi:hypothetical protein